MSNSRIPFCQVATSMFVILSACSGASGADGKGISDSAFAAVQERGSAPGGMGVDQATSQHQFDLLPDGGRIELLRMTDDTAGVRQVREHLQAIAAAFKSGDFSTPAFVHMKQVPGTSVMADKRAVMTYTYLELPRGGELRITTSDSTAVAAVHSFVEFQRVEHRSGGANATQHDPAHHGAAGHK